MMIRQILWVASDKSPYLFLWVFLWIHERIHCLCDVLYGHESCYNPCVVLFGEVCAAAVLQQLQWAHRSTGSPVVTTQGLRLGTRYFCELWWLLTQAWLLCAGSFEGWAETLNSCLCDREFVFCPCSFRGRGCLHPFCPSWCFPEIRDAVESTGQWSSGREQ